MLLEIVDNFVKNHDAARFQSVAQRVERYNNRKERVEREVVAKTSRGSALLMNGKFLTSEDVKKQVRDLIPLLVNFT